MWPLNSNWWSHLCTCLCVCVCASFYTVSTVVSIYPHLRSLRSRGGVASHSRARNSNIIIPKRVRPAPIALPAEIHPRDLGDQRAPRPPGGVGVGLAGPDGEPRDGGAVQPRLDGAVGAEVVLEAGPGARRQGLGGRDALRGEVGQGGVVGLAVVHEDGRLPADAEVLVGALGRVRVGDEGDVVCGESSRRFAACGQEHVYN